MRKYFNYIPHLILAIILFLVFKAWFMLGLITGGDFWPFFNSMYSIRPISLYAWDWGNPAGIGSFAAPLLWIYLNFGIPITVLGKWLGLNWEIVERVYYLFPFLGLSLFSSIFLFRKIFSKNYFYLLSASIFIFNTYILMVVGGGQVPGIGIAYALSPLVLYSFIKLVNFKKFGREVFKYSVISSIILSLQLLFDIRIAYITLFAIFIYWIIKIIENKNFKYFLYSFVFAFLIPGIFSFLLHSFWIIPTIFSHRNPVQDLGPAYSSTSAVKFFSFAKFENTISLLHPNWPENIFGKVGFMKPVFLVLPIFAYISLLFISKIKEQKTKAYILYFAILGLLGSFLAKGANEPFGAVYLWMFSHIPGFAMFRDSSKWYTLVALSYSILIPFSVWKIYESIKSKSKFSIFNFQFSIKNRILNFQNLFVILTCLYLALLIRPATLGQLTGLFRTNSVPSDYIKLEKFLSSQNNFYRTLWVPTQQRFSYYSNNHPAIPANDFFKVNSPKDDIDLLKKDETLSLLQEAGVKYVIIPYDSMEEIFLKDRKYDNSLYIKTIEQIKKISWVRPVNDFGKIAVFEVSNPRDHFWSTSSNLLINYKYINPTKYEVSLRNARKGDILVFAESFDLKWVASAVSGIKYKASSIKYDERLNSFILSKEGDYNLEIYYTPQDWVNTGLWVSGLSLLAIPIILFGFKLRKW